MLKNISSMSKGQLSLSYGNFYLSLALQKFLLSILTQNLYLAFRNVPAFSLPASVWTNSSCTSSLLLLLQGAFASRTSLLESSTKLSPS
jgi:hypothetical protein